VLTTTFARAKEANACIESYRKFAKFKGGVTKWGKDTPFPLSEVLEVCGLNDALWALRIVIEPADREMRLFACDCAKRVLPIFEEEYPEDNRPRRAIETARRFALGKATQEELAAAAEAAWAAAVEVARTVEATRTVAEAAYKAAWAAEAAAETARAVDKAAWAAEAASGAAAEAAAGATARARVRAAAVASETTSGAGWDAEREWQKKRFIELLDSIPNL
jgi:hypothetical protein